MTPPSADYQDGRLSNESNFRLVLALCKGDDDHEHDHYSET